MSKYTFEKVSAYVEMLPTLENPLITIDLDDVARFDPDLAHDFFTKEHHKDIYDDFFKAIRLRRLTKKSFALNFLPHKLMKETYISCITHECENMPFKFTGYVDAISGITTQTKCSFVCEACKAFNHDTRIIKTCKTCGTRVSSPKDMLELEQKSIREFILSESYDYRQVSESINCYVQVFKDENINIFEVENMLGKKLDFMGVVELKQTKTKCYPVVKIIGIRDARTYQLSQEKKTKIDEFIDNNQATMLDILRRNIFFDHLGDDWELKAMLVCAIGLNPVDKELRSTKSLQMIFQWVGSVGIGKSHLMKSLSRFLENSTIVGKTSSESGIIGGVEKNAQGQFIFRLGEIVKCNNGVLFCDEIGMWSESLQNALSEQMSDGTLTYTKIIKSKQKLFLNYILVGNPRTGKYDESKTVFQNLGGTHQINDRATIQIVSKKDDVPEDEFEKIMDYAVNRKTHKKELDDYMIRDILKRIKEYDNPVFTKETYTLAKSKFRKLAMLAPRDEDRFDSTRLNVKLFRVRAWESFYKFCKAVGRIKRHEFVTPDDVKEAWDIMFNASYLTLLKDYGDIDLAQFELVESEKIRRGIARPQSNQRLIEWIVEQTQKQDGVSKQDLVVQVVERWGFRQTKLDKIIELLKQNGEIFMLPNGNYKEAGGSGPGCKVAKDRT